MDELENLKNEHSRMLFLIGKMYKDGDISQDVKINLKYLVFLNDANLLGILKKEHTNIDEMKHEIKYLGKNLNHEDLEQELKDSDLFAAKDGEINDTSAQKTSNPEEDQYLNEVSSPISSFLRDAKKRNQNKVKSVTDFKIESNGPTDKGNKVIAECDFGASPKIQAMSKRKG